MRRFSIFLSAAVLLSLACERSLPLARRTAYAPMEEGLTLIYEDTSLPPEMRFQERLQRRVAVSKDSPQGRRVTITYSTLRSNQSFDFLSKDGSWVMMRGDAPLMELLPEGFPDRVQQWGDQAQDLSWRVIGRGTLGRSRLQLPADFDRTGIWVELDARNGARRRIFLLPGIGEAEGYLFKDNKWVMVNQLVSRGFTEAPAQPEP